MLQICAPVSGAGVLVVAYSASLMEFGGYGASEADANMLLERLTSMSTVGRLTLDAQLLRLPKELGEFVIVHELAHLLAPNHGRVFKSFMLAYLPDWEDREQRLQSRSQKRVA